MDYQTSCASGKTQKENLCLAGGVALNCVGNGRLLREGPFKKIWIQPAAGDAGGALGAALEVWYRYLGKRRVATEKEDFAKGSYLGPSFSDEYIENFLNSNDILYQRLNLDEFVPKVSQLISQEKVIGWFQGRMEFGPRALGSRSIIGDARSKKMQSIMNLKIKYRESFRPFAPSVLEEDVSEYFGINQASPYMLLVAPIKKERRISAELHGNLLSLKEKINAPRSDIPAVTHVDYSARVQTVDKDRHGRYYRLLQRFKDKTGCPLIINTSFNIRGEPIVCTPENAYRCFMATNMDVLVMENQVLLKEEQPQAKRYEIDEYLSQFDLD